VQSHCGRRKCDHFQASVVGAQREYGPVRGGGQGYVAGVI